MKRSTALAGETLVERSASLPEVDWTLTRLRDRALDELIVPYIREGDRVLDLGCGSGDLILRLKQQKRIQERGIEIDGNAVTEAIAKGLSVIHGDLEDGLGYLDDRCYDLVILNQVITVIGDPVSILEESLRVGHRVAVTFPNFAFFRTRVQLAIHGRLPVTPSLPYQWYDTPNIRLVTVKDFRNLCHREGIKIQGEHFVALDKNGQFDPIRLWPNLRASSALFMLEQ